MLLALSEACEACVHRELHHRQHTSTELSSLLCLMLNKVFIWSTNANQSMPGIQWTLC